MKKKHGFTIIELLVVIVIIAILATLVVSAYSGIQVQANNTKTATVVRSYQQALLIYAAEKGKYPANSTTVSSCLGEGYSTNTCFRSSVTIGNTNSFNNNIRPYMGSVNPLPLPATTVFTSGDTDYWGAVFFYNNSTSLDGQPHHWWIIYYQAGKTRCPVGPVINTASYPNNSSAPPADGITTYRTNGNFSECWISMPDPTAL